MLKITAIEALPQKAMATWRGRRIPLLKRLEIDSTSAKIKVIFGSGNVVANAVEPLPLEYLDPERAAGEGPASLAELTGVQPVEHQDMSRVHDLLKERDEVVQDMREAGYDVAVESIRP